MRTEPLADASQRNPRGTVGIGRPRELGPSAPVQRVMLSFDHHLNTARYGSTFSLVTIVTGTAMFFSTVPPLMTFIRAVDRGSAHAGRILLDDRRHIARVDSLYRLGREIPADHLDLSCLPWLSTAATAPSSAGSPVA